MSDHAQTVIKPGPFRYLPSLKLTAKAPEKWMVGSWKINELSLGANGLFSGSNLLLVLGRVGMFFQKSNIDTKNGHI